MNYIPLSVVYYFNF